MTATNKTLFAPLEQGTNRCTSLKAGERSSEDPSKSNFSSDFPTENFKKPTPQEKKTKRRIYALQAQTKSFLPSESKPQVVA